MGYREAQQLYKEKHGKLAKSSWIAQILSEHGKTKGKAPTRKGNYKYPCPDSERPKLEKLLKELKMI
ncbi:hypothetical protein [Nitrosopumilus sp. b1]|uniref:hypothetical protein n=1 Tax=Nitrosopumilus sp. b1 TaxID=2109907 RepID=UPI0015F5D3D0|nr:hypothetical protein [Nitrosopumilus sp. b1]